MRAIRSRRIVRRTVMVLAAVVLLPAWYVSSYATVYWCFGHQTISTNTYLKLRESVFAPADWYSETDYPGGQQLKTLACWSLFKGRGSKGMSWEVADMAAKSGHKGWR